MNIQHRTSNALYEQGKILIMGTVKGFVKRVKKMNVHRRVVASAVLFSQSRASGYDGAVVCSEYAGKVFGLSV